MLAYAQTALTYVLPFLFVLTIVVTIHELGHFLAARSCRVAVDRFSIGFGRALVRWRDKAGTEWRIGWIPLGGYVRFAGDEDVSSVPDADDLNALRREVVAHEGAAGLKRYFHFKPLWQRSFVVAAGPLSNFLLSIGLFAILLMSLGENLVPAKVTGIVAGSPAAAAGFQVGDIVQRAAGRTIESFSDLREVVMVRAGETIRIDVLRDGKPVMLTATPHQAMMDDGLGHKMSGGMLGITSEPQASDVIHKRYGPGEALARGAFQTWDVLDTTLHYFGKVVRGQASASEIHGPLGVAQMSHDMAKAGASNGGDFWSRVRGSGVGLLYLVAVYSVGIGFMNLLPIPILDGGHLLFYAYEAVARRPVAAQVQAAGYRVGLALLLGLMLFATTNDLQRSSVLHFLGGLFS